MTESHAARTIAELITQWREDATLLRVAAHADRGRSSVGLAQPKEWEAHAKETCADELEALQAAPVSPVEPVCRECGCQTGGGAYCYEHAPYQVWPLKDGSFRSDRHGMRHIWLTEPPSTESTEQAAQDALDAVVSHWFTQGGEAQFGAIPEAESADQVVSAILSVVRATYAGAEEQIDTLEEQITELVQDRDAARAVSVDDALSSPMAAGLVLQLKAECEAQHARAEAAEQQIAALTADRDALQAGRFWACCHAEQELDDALMTAFGADANVPSTWPAGDCGYDDYDTSFELWGTRNDFTPTDDHLAAVFALGFSRGWICYQDGTEVCVTPTARGARRPSRHEASERKRLRRLNAVALSEAEQQIADQEQANITLMALVETWTARARAAEALLTVPSAHEWDCPCVQRSDAVCTCDVTSQEIPPDPSEPQP